MRENDPTRPSVILVDSDERTHSRLETALSGTFALLSFTSLEAGLDAVGARPVAAFLLNADQSKVTPVVFLNRLYEAAPFSAGIVLTENDSATNLREIFAAGAFDCLSPFCPAEYLLPKLKQASENFNSRQVTRQLAAAVRRNHRVARAFLHDLADPLATIVNVLDHKALSASNNETLQLVEECGTNCVDLLTLYGNCLCPDRHAPGHETFEVETLLRCAFSTNSDLAISKGVRVQIKGETDQLKIMGNPASLLFAMDYLLRVAFLLCHRSENRVIVRFGAQDDQIEITFENHQEGNAAPTSRLKSARMAANCGLTDFTDCEEIIRTKWGGSVAVEITDEWIRHVIRISRHQVL